MKSKLLYIGEKIDKVSGGAEVVNKRNQTLLESFFSVTYIPIQHGRIANFFFGITRTSLKMIDAKLQDNTFEYVFVQQSLMGRACFHIKEKYPNQKIIVFYHNIEIQYAKEYLKTIGVRSLPFYMLVKYWEKKATKYTDYCITLNGRDSKLLKSIYQRDSDLEVPTSFPDHFSYEKSQAASIENQPPIDYLFVGVAFFANVEAVQWFIDNVMPKVEGNLYIVGKGMDGVDFKNISSQVHIYGFVVDLSDFYYRAKIVISPIHVGGGMKTKTAEALMYGKTILGSSEAFEGYEIDDRCMILCNTADEYIDNIRKLRNSTSRLNILSRNLFLKKYSNKVAEEQLRLFFN